MKLLFADFDHVMNIGRRHSNGRCGLTRNRVRELNRILRAVPDLQLVIHSAWRYWVHNGLMTVEGLSEALRTHGIACKGRIHGVTPSDEFTAVDFGYTGPTKGPEWWAWIKENGVTIREIQIRHYWLNACKTFRPWAAVDDLPLDLGEGAFQTDRKKGLTPEIADRIIAHLSAFSAPPSTSEEVQP